MDAGLRPIGGGSAPFPTYAQLDARYVNQVGGDVITGETQINVAPTKPFDIVNKTYLDSKVNTICSSTGGAAKACLTLDGTSSPTSNISMGNFRITNTSNPVNLYDVATKQYVDQNKFSTTTADQYYWRIDGSNNPYGIKVYRIIFTTASVADYTVSLRIGESSASLSYDYPLNNDSTIFPSSSGSFCSWAFGDNGDNLYPFFIAHVDGTEPRRTALVYVYINKHFNNQVGLTLNVNYHATEETTMQSLANTFPIFHENFAGSNTPYYTITFTTAEVTNYVVNILIGESAGTVGANFNLNNDSSIFPSESGAACSFAFGKNGNNYYKFFVENVTGSRPNRVASVWINITENFRLPVKISLVNKFSGTSMQSADDTFIFFDTFSSTSIDPTKWHYNGDVSTSNGICNLSPNNSELTCHITSTRLFDAGYKMITNCNLPTPAGSYAGFGFDNNIVVANKHDFPRNSLITENITGTSAHWLRIPTLSASSSQRVIIVSNAGNSEVIIGTNTYPVSQAHSHLAPITFHLGTDPSIGLTSPMSTRYVLVCHHVPDEPVFSSFNSPMPVSDSKWFKSTNVSLNNNLASIGSTKNEASSLRGLPIPNGDNIELIFKANLANTSTSNFAGGGFYDYFLLNNAQDASSTVVRNLANSDLNLYNIITPKSAGIPNLYRIARSGTNGRVIIGLHESTDTYHGFITHFNLAQSYLYFAAHDANVKTTISFVAIRKYIRDGPRLSLVSSTHILNLNGLSIVNSAGGTLPSDVAAISNINHAVNIICGTTEGCPNPCLTLDGASRMTGNLDMGNKAINNLGEPNRPNDSVTLNYLYNHTVNIRTKRYCEVLVFNTSPVRTNSSTREFTIPNSDFTSNNALLLLLVSPHTSGHYDRFAVTSSTSSTSNPFGPGTFTLSVTATYKNTTGGWAEQLELLVQILYR